MAIGVRHQFIGLLGSRIKTDRVIYIILYRKRQFGVGAVDGRGRGEQQMPTFIVPAPFQHIDEALHVGIDIGMGMLQRITNAGLRGEMDHHSKAVLRK